MDLLDKIEGRLPEYIEYLLERDHMVMLPGIGFFNLISNPTEFDKSDLVPKSRTLEFNPEIHRYDAEVAQLVSRDFGLGISKSRLLLLQVADKIFSISVHSLNNTYQLGDLGYFEAENSRLVFNENESKINHNFYGFEAITAHKVSRAELVYQDVINEPIKEIKLNTARHRPLYYQLRLVASFIGILVVFGLMLSGNRINSLELQEASFFQSISIFNQKMPSSFPGSISPYSPVPIQLEDNRIDKNLEIESEFPITKLENTNLEEGYYIIVGSFGAETNARKLQTSLILEGKERTIITKSDNNYYRVGYFLTNSNAEFVELTSNSENYKEGAWFVRVI